MYSAKTKIRCEYWLSDLSWQKENLLFAALALHVNIVLSCLNKRPVLSFFSGETEIVSKDHIAGGAQSISLHENNIQLLAACREGLLSTSF